MRAMAMAIAAGSSHDPSKCNPDVHMLHDLKVDIQKKLKHLDSGPALLSHTVLAIRARRRSSLPM